MGGSLGKEEDRRHSIVMNPPPLHQVARVNVDH